jgi:hypothetical protein
MHLKALAGLTTLNTQAVPAPALDPRTRPARGALDAIGRGQCFAHTHSQNVSHSPPNVRPDYRCETFCFWIANTGATTFGCFDVCAEREVRQTGPTARTFNKARRRFGIGPSPKAILVAGHVDGVPNMVVTEHATSADRFRNLQTVDVASHRRFLV